MEIEDERDYYTKEETDDRLNAVLKIIWDLSLLTGKDSAADITMGRIEDIRRRFLQQ